VGPAQELVLGAPMARPATWPGLARLGLRASASGPLALYVQWLCIGIGRSAPGGFSDGLSLRVE
jgi:hypothetical protein